MFCKQKGERAVLQGIVDADWAKIGQVVLEVHDIDGTLAWVVGLLESKGFIVTSEQDQGLSSTDLYNVYAVREKRPSPHVNMANALSPQQFIGELQEQVNANLPDYMMPQGFVLLDKLPLPRNGKIDRRALPEPQSTSSARDLVLPRNKTEQALAEIWQEVLGIATIGVQDDFFALGGHSLLATQLIARIPPVLGVKLPLNAVFETPTIEGLAEQIETLKWASGMAGSATEESFEQGTL